MGEHDEAVLVATTAGREVRPASGRGPRGRRIGRWLAACGLAAGVAVGTTGCAPIETTAAAGTETASPTTSQVAPTSPAPATTDPAAADPTGSDAGSSSLRLHHHGASTRAHALTTARGPRASAPVATGAGNPWGDTYTNVDGAQVQRPVAAPSAPAGATAQCGDGTWSFSRHHQGTCSRHGGVARFL